MIKKKVNSLKNKKDDRQYINIYSEPIHIEDLTVCLSYLKDLKNKNDLTEEEYNFLVRLGITRFVNYKVEEKILKPLEKLSNKNLT